MFDASGQAGGALGTLLGSERAEAVELRAQRTGEAAQGTGQRAEGRERGRAEGSRPLRKWKARY